MTDVSVTNTKQSGRLWIRRKPIGQDCVFFSQWTNTRKNATKRFPPLNWEEAERKCNEAIDPNRGNAPGHLLAIGKDDCKARYSFTKLVSIIEQIVSITLIYVLVACYSTSAL